MSEHATRRVHVPVTLSWIGRKKSRGDGTDDFQELRLYDHVSVSREAPSCKLTSEDEISVVIAAETNCAAQSETFLPVVGVANEGADGQFFNVRDYPTRLCNLVKKIVV